MADIIDATLPDDREPAKLGAQRIREVKSLLNLTIAKIFDSAGNFFTNWITGDMLQTNSVSRDKILNGEVIAGKLGPSSVVAANITAGQVGSAHFDPSALQLMARAYGHVSYIAPGPPELRNAYGVDMVTRIGTGQYKITYSPKFGIAGAPWIYQTIVATPEGIATEYSTAKVIANQPDYFTLQFFWGAAVDPSGFSFAVFSMQPKTT